MEILNEQEYEKFVSTHKKSHFMQSYYWGDVAKHKNFTPHYVGIKEKGKIVAAALLLQKRMPLGFSYFYSPRGFMLDYDNQKMLEKFTKEVKKYAKECKAIFVKIDPDIRRQNYDSNGNIISEETEYINNLKKIGFKHKGYNIEFTNEQPRFTFRLDITPDYDSILANMHSSTRRKLSKENVFELYKGSVDDIQDFYKVMEETAAREHLGCNPICYYKSFYTILHEKNMSDLYVAKINIKDLKKKYNDNIKALNDKIEILKNNTNANPKKQQNKIGELNAEIKKINKDLEELLTIEEDELVLSSIITAKYGDKLWIIHSGNSTALRSLNSNYFLYNKILNDAKEEGYELLDFFGCSGDYNPDKKSHIAGLHNFKKMFGGEYIEFIGELDLVVNPIMYNLFNILIPLRRKLVKRKKVKENEKK